MNTFAPHTAQDVDPRRDTKVLLNAQGIKKSYAGRTVVNDVHISVREGEIVGLLGPNGAGKTTSFYMIAGLIPPDAGKVSFGGNDISSLPMHKRARLGMGYLPQEESIFRNLTVEDNLLAVLETRRDISRKDRHRRCDELLERFNITKLRKSEALALSGGEKRRLTIARSLCTDPKLLMLDEPFSGVDPIAVGDIQNIVRELRDEDGLSILITDHNVRETLHIVDHAYLLAEGKLILEGEAHEIANNPIARKHYLGEDFVL
ncbi:MAG: LPS export ABC transporter ATP-binding protein [Akkermansiaceae bacterium]